MREAVFCLILATSASAYACGYCVEDKIAAVYDHAAIERALAERQTVVFFAIDGPLSASANTRVRLQAIADATSGVIQGSARVSVDAAALAVAYDPRRMTLAAVQRLLERRLAPYGLSLAVLRIVDK